MTLGSTPESGQSAETTFTTPDLQRTPDTGPVFVEPTAAEQAAHTERAETARAAVEAAKAPLTVEQMMKNAPPAVDSQGGRIDSYSKGRLLPGEGLAREDAYKRSQGLPTSADRASANAAEASKSQGPLRKAWNRLRGR